MSDCGIALIMTTFKKDLSLLTIYQALGRTLMENPRSFDKKFNMACSSTKIIILTLNIMILHY